MFLDPHSTTGRSITLRGLTLHLSPAARRLIHGIPEAVLHQARVFQESTTAGVLSLRVLDARGVTVSFCSTRTNAESGEASSRTADRLSRPDHTSAEAESSWWPTGGRPQRSESAFDTPAVPSSRRVDPRVLEAELQAMVLRARAARDEGDEVVEGEVGMRTTAGGRSAVELGQEGLFAPDGVESAVSATSAVFEQHTHPLLSRSPGLPPPTPPVVPGAGLGEGWAEAARAEVHRRHALTERTRRHDGQEDLAWRQMHPDGEEVEGDAEEEDLDGMMEIRRARVERVGR